MSQRTRTPHEVLTDVEQDLLGRCHRSHDGDSCGRCRLRQEVLDVMRGLPHPGGGDDSKELATVGEQALTSSAEELPPSGGSTRIPRI